MSSSSVVYYTYINVICMPVYFLSLCVHHVRYHIISPPKKTGPKSFACSFDYLRYSHNQLTWYASLHKIDMCTVCVCVCNGSEWIEQVIILILNFVNKNQIAFWLIDVCFHYYWVYVYRFSLCAIFYAYINFDEVER